MRNDTEPSGNKDIMKYQSNPEANWGPKARAGGKKRERAQSPDGKKKVK
jgi:hypothetical protein